MRFINVIILIGLISNIKSTEIDQKIEDFFYASTHTNNWAVLVSTSRFWFNYRHVANVLSIYQSIKRLGIPDSNIIVMLADNIPCNARNPHPGEIYNYPTLRDNLYGLNVEVDYRGYEVSVDNFMRVLMEQMPEGTPRNKRLLSDHQSNILIYMSGHGGEGFLKFQDHTQLSSNDVADAFDTMYKNQRYNEILFIVDSCQSASMYSEIRSPNIISTASSLVGEDSKSYKSDADIGVHVVDRYAYFAHRFLEDNLDGVDPLQKNVTLLQFLKACTYEKCDSTVGISTDNYRRSPEHVRAADFFGARKYKKILKEEYESTDEWDNVEYDFEKINQGWKNLGIEKDI